MTPDREGGERWTAGQCGPTSSLHHVQATER